MIKAFIIAAVTADGYIAKDAQHSSFHWNSKEDKKRFIEITKRAGVIIMGSNTYKTLPKALSERVNIVYSRSGKTFEGAEVTSKEPTELLKDLEARGFKEVAICGGSQIYTMFMKSKVVDRIYLSIEPIIFGKGVRLFDEDMLYHLKLENSMQAENGTLLLDYKVEYVGNPKTD